MQRDSLPCQDRGQKNPVVEPFRGTRETPAQLLATLHGSYQLLGRLLDSHRNDLLRIIGEEVYRRLAEDVEHPMKVMLRPRYGVAGRRGRVPPEGSGLPGRR